VALRDRFPAWFDAARFRAAFVLEPAGLPLAETRYSATSMSPTEGIGVDVQLEYTDDRGDLRAEMWRRVEEIDGELVAIHVVLSIIDMPAHPQGRFQGHGIARRSMDRAIGLYDRLGVRRIVLAATDTGRLVWPKFGFRLAPDDREAFVAAVRVEHRRAFGSELALAIPESGHQLVELRRGKVPLGRAALKARLYWTMTLDLTDSGSRSILDEELRR
jgi:GNAT superfamily N-acetyltransferase